MHKAAKNGHDDVAKFLLEHMTNKMPQDAEGWTPLHYFASNGHLKIIIWYKDVLGFKDINPKDNKGDTPLSLATQEGHLDVVKYYIENGYQASSKIYSPFINHPHNLSWK